MLGLRLVKLEIPNGSSGPYGTVNELAEWMPAQSSGLGGGILRISAAVSALGTGSRGCCLLGPCAACCCPPMLLAAGYWLLDPGVIACLPPLDADPWPLAPEAGAILGK